MSNNMFIDVNGRILASHTFPVLDGNMGNWPMGFPHMIIFTADQSGLLMAAICCYQVCDYPWACTRTNPAEDDAYIMNFQSLEDSNRFVSAFSEAIAPDVPILRLINQGHDPEGVID